METRLTRLRSLIQTAQRQRERGEHEENKTLLTAASNKLSDY